MLKEQQFIQQLKLYWVVNLTFKKDIRPIKLTASASNIILKKRYFIIKYYAGFVIPRVKKIFYEDIKTLRAHFKRKEALFGNEFEKMTSNKICPKRIKEAQKLFLIRMLIAISLIIVVALLSIVIVLIFNAIK